LSPEEDALPKEILMLHYEGEKDFPQPPPELWGYLSDARFLARCVPDAEAVTRAEPAIAEFKVRPGLAFVRGTLNALLQVVEAQEAASLRLRVVGKGIGSSSTVDAALVFEPCNGGSRVHWTADITQLDGLLKAVPRGLIQAAAQKVIEDLWAAVAARLRGGGT
jgi:carbon monoxide dehydrogenase subunit G